MHQNERLLLVYQQVGPLMYGAISRYRGEGETLEWSYPYIVSKRVNGEEVVYGSIPYLIGEVAKPIFRMGRRIRKLGETLPEEIQSSVHEITSGNEVIRQLPESGVPDSFISHQEELLKEALLGSGIHIRTLLEILSGRGNLSVSVYDYDGNSIDTVTLTWLFNSLMHYRSCVISERYIHDVFSDRSQLESQRLFGSRLNTAEVFQAMLDYITGITVNDFVGVIRGQLERLNLDSEPRDIMFTVQNVHSLDQVIGDRISDGRFPEVLVLLFREFTSDEESTLEAAEGASAVPIVRQFKAPKFQIGAALHDKQIQMSININGKSEQFTFGYEEFFDVLTRVYGEEPLLSFDKLVERYDKLAF